MSSWTALNIQTDDAESLAEYLTESDDGQKWRLSANFPQENDDYDHVEGFNLVVSSFEQPPLERLMQLCNESGHPIEIAIGVRLNDTSDGGTLKVYTPDSMGAPAESFAVNVRGGVSGAATFYETEVEGHVIREVEPTVTEVLQEKYGVRPSAGGNYR